MSRTRSCEAQRGETVSPSNVQIIDEDTVGASDAGGDEIASDAQVLGVRRIAFRILAAPETDDEAVGVRRRLALEVTVRTVIECEDSGELLAERG